MKTVTLSTFKYGFSFLNILLLVCYKLLFPAIFLFIYPSSFILVFSINISF